MPSPSTAGAAAPALCTRRCWTTLLTSRATRSMPAARPSWSMRPAPPTARNAPCRRRSFMPTLSPPRPTNMATESTPRSRQRRHLLIAGAAAAAAARVPAQDPGPPIRLIVPYAAGGPIDLTARGGAGGRQEPAAPPLGLFVPYAAGGPIDVTARVLAERVRDTLGTVLIDNKGGAGGNIGADAIARAAPDGLTIGIAATATHAVNPWLYARLPYDAAKDFAGITQLVRVPNVLVMNVARAEQFG